MTAPRMRSAQRVAWLLAYVAVGLAAWAAVLVLERAEFTHVFLLVSIISCGGSGVLAWLHRRGRMALLGPFAAYIGFTAASTTHVLSFVDPEYSWVAGVMAIAALFPAILGSLSGYWIVLLRSPGRPLPGTCAACGYDMGGLPRCPECGTSA